MTQRKLTDEERQIVGSASFFLSKAAGLSGWPGDCWRDAARQLNEMLNTGTTDGQPYVDPEPPILDGYRLAVAGDEGRADCMIWRGKERGYIPRWNSKSAASHCEFQPNETYIVPIDRTPTDEDAKSRPEVMVRDGSEPWQEVVLYGVLEKNAYPFLIVQQATRVSGRFKYCRHLYPGE